MSEYRPIKTISQIAAALETTDDRAGEPLKALERMGLAEEAHSGYRATRYAWMRYPRPRPKPKQEPRAA